MVWSLEPYGFLSAEQAPPTVDPSLWRQSRLNMHHGLFEVVPGVYQVRGLDIANMTLIEGDSGVIVVDTLTSIEGARAAMELYFQHRGKRPVVAVIFTHTHTDHWGGARGVLDDETLAGGKVPIIAPNLFMEHAVSENIIAGPRDAAARAISVRPVARPRAYAGRSIAGSARPWRRGQSRCCAPTDLIIADWRQAHHRRGGNRIPDGAEQRSAGGNALLHPRYKLFEPRGETATHNFHNLLHAARRRSARRAGMVKISSAKPCEMWGGRADGDVRLSITGRCGATNGSTHDPTKQRDLYNSRMTRPSG